MDLLSGMNFMDTRNTFAGNQFAMGGTLRIGRATNRSARERGDLLAQVEHFRKLSHSEPVSLPLTSREIKFIPGRFYMANLPALLLTVLFTKLARIWAK